MTTDLQNYLRIKAEKIQREENRLSEIRRAGLGFKHFEYCAICTKRITKNKRGGNFCDGHYRLEVAVKLQYYKQLKLI